MATAPLLKRLFAQDQCHFHAKRRNISSLKPCHARLYAIDAFYLIKIIRKNKNEKNSHPIYSGNFQPGKRKFFPACLSAC